MEIKNETIRIFDKQIRNKSQELFKLQKKTTELYSATRNIEKNNNIGLLSSNYDINPIQEINCYQNYNSQNNQYYQQQDLNNFQYNQYQQQNDFNNLQKKINIISNNILIIHKIININKII